jgi:hypothetical protein
MKLRALDTRPPQSMRVTLDATTHDKLTAYLAYAAEQGQIFKDMRQLLTEIARAFVEHGDKGFTAWYRAQQGAAAVPPHRPNGDTAAHTSWASEVTLTVVPGGQKVGGGEAENGKKAGGGPV